MNEPEVKVSVILPVYNPGEGIRKCIDCLINQTLREIELIFIDDCGQDGAVEIIMEAAGRDNRIRLIDNPENMGAGRSRNRGIQEARGEYLAFVDPDDYVSQDFLKVLYSKGVQTDADIVKGVCKIIENDGSIGSDDPHRLNNKIKEGLQRRYPLFALFAFQHTTAIYRRKMILSGKVGYAPSNYSEDAAFLLKACANTSHIEFAEEAIYYYVSRGESSVRNFSVSRWTGELDSLKDMLGYIENHKMFTPEGVRFAIGHIVTVLDLQKYFDDREETHEESKGMLEELRTSVKALSFSQELMGIDVVIDILIKHRINLSPMPYGWQWRWIPYREYISRVKKWVGYLRKHPEDSCRSQNYLWRVFENAIDYDGWEKEKEYKKGSSLKEIRRLANQLPDRKVLTNDFISMKLFVDYGIDTFSLRKTKLGETVKQMASKVRQSG